MSGPEKQGRGGAGIGNGSHEQGGNGAWHVPKPYAQCPVKALLRALDPKDKGVTPDGLCKVLLVQSGADYETGINAKGITRMAEDVGVQRRTVAKWLTKGIENGHVEVVGSQIQESAKRGRWTRGRWQRNRYRVNWGALAARAPIGEPAVDDSPRALPGEYPQPARAPMGVRTVKPDRARSPGGTHKTTTPLQSTTPEPQQQATSAPGGSSSATELPERLLLLVSDFSQKFGENGAATELVSDLLAKDRSTERMENALTAAMERTSDDVRVPLALLRTLWNKKAKPNGQNADAGESGHGFDAKDPQREAWRRKQDRVPSAADVRAKNQADYAAACASSGTHGNYMDAVRKMLNPSEETHDDE